MSAGQSIHNTFPVVFSNLKGINEAWVFVEEGVYENEPENENDSEEKKERRKTKILIQQSIKSMEVKCRENFVKFREIRVKNTSLTYIRDSVLLNLNKTDYSRISFNLSGGTKMLSLSLFVMALWLNGDIYLTPRGGGIEKIAIPKMHLTEIRQNINYINALKILARKNEKSHEEDEALWVPGKDFSRILTVKYRPARLNGEEKIKKSPNKGTISKIKSQLEEWGLIEERSRPGNKREKEYRITSDGIFALAILNSEEEKSNS
ncbi:hypothetical protein [Methanoplanus limicola]|nr:hypothetical protein [Methanoplanus limicola]